MKGGIVIIDENIPANKQEYASIHLLISFNERGGGDQPWAMSNSQ